jgi:hypothetical protein
MLLIPWVIPLSFSTLGLLWLQNALRGAGCFPAIVYMTDSRSEAKSVRPLRRPVKSPLDRRWEIAWNAELHTRSGQLPAIIEDVSADGAKLRVGRVPIDGEQVTLVLPNLSPMEARIAWRRRERIGIQFLTSQRWIVELLMRITEIDDGPPITVA